jgi:hypothetical protein
MLSDMNVPKEFWPDAVKWATYVLNRSPTLAVKDMTPEEAWSGQKPFVHHFRVFGCLAVWLMCMFMMCIERSLIVRVQHVLI